MPDLHFDQLDINKNHSNIQELTIVEPTQSNNFELENNKTVDLNQIESPGSNNSIIEFDSHKIELPNTVLSDIQPQNIETMQVEAPEVEVTEIETIEIEVPEVEMS